MTGEVLPAVLPKMVRAEIKALRLMFQDNQVRVEQQEVPLPVQVAGMQLM
jgi:hypothetical protein